VGGWRWRRGRWRLFDGKHNRCRRIVYTPERLEEILSPRYFVAVRRTPGGPAPEQTSFALEASRARLDTDRQWCTERRGALAAAERLLAERSAAL